MVKTTRLALSLWALSSIAVFACQVGPPEGLRATPEGDGPMVIHDLDARPLPEIPFPNDLATRADSSSATGRRINASMVAPTSLERMVRTKLDLLDGFGTMQPITVRFDAPLDITALLDGHRNDLDFGNDAVYLIDIDPDSPDFGRPYLLDIGRGNYPLTLKRTDHYFASDPRAQASNVVFDTVEEDLDGDGVLDPGEDTDDDGVLDHPNVWQPGIDPIDGLMTFYESETNTLILRPLVPLRERTTYAVVLTGRLLGADGNPVRSPFEWVHHLNQVHDLERLVDVFANWTADGIAVGITLDDVAFAWSFTTQSVTADLVAIREGLYGIGPLAFLAEEFGPDAIPTQTKDEDPYYLLETEALLNVFWMVGPALLGDNMDMAGPILDSFDYVDYFVAGSFASPDFMLTDMDGGLDPQALHRENLEVDIQAGTASYTPNRVRFIMAVPKETDRYKPPFPVVIYCHSYSSMRAEALGFAGYMARQGMATVGIEAWGHGIPVDDELADIIVTVGEAFGFGPFARDLLEGRARDLDGDGSLDSGGDYWTAYAFHTRDVVRQSVADHFQFVRVLRAFDGSRTWDLDQDGDGQPDLAGDFNYDGKVDAGGPDVPYFAWGQSGGGITSAVLSPLEPHIIAAAPTVGGGGLSDVGLRTMLGNVRNAVMLRSMGPLVVGEPVQGGMRVSLHVSLSTLDQRLDIAVVGDLQPGDLVVVTNVTKSEEYEAHVQPGPRFRVSMAADLGDEFEVAFYDSEGSLLERLTTYEQDVFFFKNDEPTYAAGAPLETPAEGFGLARCTPDLRRMIGLLQLILEPADPANYAPHYFLDPLDIQPEGKTVTNLLEVASVGDQDVPIGTQATLGRAAGLIEHLEVDDRYGMTPNDWLIDNHVYEGLAHIGRFPDHDVLFDPDNLDEGLDGFDAPGPSPDQALRVKVPTETGVSGIRFAYMQPGGQHGIFPINTDPQFDMFTYFVNLVARFFATRGTEILDDTCLATSSCTPPPGP